VADADEEGEDEMKEKGRSETAEWFAWLIDRQVRLMEAAIRMDLILAFAGTLTARGFLASRSEDRDIPDRKQR